MNFLNKLKKGALAATALALTATFSMAGSASAAPAPGDMPTTTGSITIHKHKDLGNTTELAPDGTSNAPAEPLKGVKFTITKITGVDLTKNADWEKVSTLTVENMANNGATRSTDVRTVTTGVNGEAKADNLKTGLYLVEETSVGNNPITKKSAPFFVTIPLPFNNKWLTNVHVYPKNIVKTPGTKEVTEDTNTHKVGDQIGWTVTTTASSDNPSAYGVVDQLEDYLTYVDKSAKAYLNDDAAPLTDVTVATGTTPKKHVKISLGSEALKKIHKGDKVKFVLQTRVDSIPENGVVKNSAWPIENDYNPFENPNPDNPTPNVPPIIPTKDPYFGDYKFMKVDSANPAKALSGAKFGLYTIGNNGHAGTLVSQATSGEDGVVAFNGIYLGTFDKGTAATDATKQFVVKEIEAPSGYVLSNAEKTITIKAGHVSGNTDLEKVTNTPQSGPKLPLTGAAGTLMLTLIGLGLVGAGTTVFVRNSRRK
ncbi:SpaH/EbpB family LPXTG-anchored major pilin [Arcanobacterium canis]